MAAPQFLVQLLAHIGQPTARHERKPTMIAYAPSPVKEAEESDREELDAEMPFIIEFCLVQGVGFTCMAYRDQDGKWRRAIDNEELSGYIKILE